MSYLIELCQSRPNVASFQVLHEALSPLLEPATGFSGHFSFLSEVCQLPARTSMGSKEFVTRDLDAMWEQIVWKPLGDLSRSMIS